MNEEIDLKNNLIKHMAYNIIAFAIILSIFAMFMFIIIKNVTYSKIDAELILAKNEILELTEMQIANFDFSFPRLFNDTKYDDIRNELKNNIKNLIENISNPRINMIIWNEKNDIIIEIGNISKFDKNKEIDKNYLDKIYDKNINNKYYYRAINFKLDYNGDNTYDYCQLLLNVDTERYLVKSYFQIILSAVIVSIIASVLASYILSKNTIKPIAMNIKKHTEFIQNASHELRTPLTIIQAKQELLLDDPNAKIIDKIEDISITLEETKRLTKLTKDLLTLTRINNKDIIIQKENTNIDEFIENIIKNYIELAKMQGKELFIKCDCKREVKIDRTKIHQLLVILIDNAIKYTECGDTIEVKTYYKDGKCIIEVRDTGIGVSDEGLKRIFERFYRDDKARNREKGGSGLGLSIASFIVNAHNGTIKAYHNNPKGTVFIIKLPK